PPVGCRNVASGGDAAARSWIRPLRLKSCRDGSMRRGDDMLDHRLDLGWEEEEPRRRPRRSGPPSRQQRRRRKKRRRQKAKSSGALIISLLLLALVGGGVYWGVGQIQNNQ